MAGNEMFSYLLDGGAPKSSDLEVLKELSKEAASAFLGKGSTPLNFSIQKIASSSNLTPGQIDVVCQEANRMVQAEMYKTAQDHYTDFELADPSVIVSNLDKSIQKTASVSEKWSEFDVAPSERNNTDFAVTKTAGFSGLTDSRKLEARKVLEKTAQQLKDIGDDLLIVNAGIESLENQFVKVAREQVIPLSLKERPEAVRHIHFFCKSAGLSDASTDRVMGLLSYVLKQQGLVEKTADLKADEKYISENLNAKIINGTHPLYITIKTLVDKNVRREALENNHNLIKTKLEDYRANGAVLGQTVSEL